MSQILLLEDDPILGRSLSIALETQGFEVKWAQDLRSARQIMQSEVEEDSSIDLYLLDWNVPDGTGLDLCKKIRSEDTQTPIIFLTAKSDEESAVDALSNGANDYIRKPFGQAELFARLKRALKESQSADEEIKFAGIKLSLGARKAFINKQEIALNRREFDILKCFVKRADTVVSREMLIQEVDNEAEIFDRTIDSHVSHLRRRLKNAGVTGLHIVSVYGVGYRLEKVSKTSS